MLIDLGKFCVDLMYIRFSGIEVRPFTPSEFNRCVGVVIFQRKCQIEVNTDISGKCYGVACDMCRYVISIIDNDEVDSGHIVAERARCMIPGAVYGLQILAIIERVI